MQIDLNQCHQPVIDCLASATRVDILRLLSRHPMNMTEIAEHLILTKAIVSRHITQLESAGLIKCTTQKGIRGLQKVCALNTSEMVIRFQCNESEILQSSWKIGICDYVGAKVVAPCGLKANGNTIGLADDPRYFLSPQRNKSDLLWCSGGSLTYDIPANPDILQDSDAIVIEFTAKFKQYGLQNKKDFLNIKLGDRTICPIAVNYEKPSVEMENIDSRLNRSLTGIVYKKKYHLEIGKDGTYMDQEKQSPFCLQDINDSKLTFNFDNTNGNVFYLFGDGGIGIQKIRRTEDKQ